MLLILEIVFLITGVWAIATAKLPAFLFGGGPYKAEGPLARMVGLLLIAPFPLALVIGFVLALLFGQRGIGYSWILELFLVIGVAIVASVAYRKIRQPIGPVDSSGQPIVDENARIEALIAKKSQGALIYSILGILGLTAIVVCPLAVIYATQALRLIEKHKLGERYRRTAQAARVIAGVIFAIYAGLVGCFLISLFLSTAAR